MGIDILFTLIITYGVCVLLHMWACNDQSKVELGVPRFFFDGIFIEEWSPTKSRTYPMWWLPNILKAI